MNPLDQRFAIAEANGYAWTEEAKQETSCASWQAYAESYGMEFIDDELPDYLNDLNAMHEVERNMTDLQKIQFTDILYNKVGRELLDWTGCYYPGELPTIDLMVIFETLHTSAAQRAEAYLRTIGKWKD